MAQLSAMGYSRELSLGALDVLREATLVSTLKFATTFPGFRAPSDPTELHFLSGKLPFHTHSGHFTDQEDGDCICKNKN